MMPTLAWAPQNLEQVVGTLVSVLEIHMDTLLPKAFIESLLLPRALVRAQGMAGVQAPPFRSSGSSWGSWERALTPGSPAYHTPRGSC